MTGDDLKQKRQAANLSRKDLGVLMGYKIRPNQRVQDFESGRRGITLATATLINLIFKNHEAQGLQQT